MLNSTQITLTTCLLFSFQLLFSQDSLPADCVTAFQACQGIVYHITGANGIGDDKVEADNTPCFRNGETLGQAEVNSIWVKFEIDTACLITFSIIPDLFEDDYDFVLYSLPEGDCKKKKIVRCMASGVSKDQFSPCMGATGLRMKEREVAADAGCSDANDDTWLKPVKAKAGEKYVLLVSNVTNSLHGFVLKFGDDTRLRCAAEDNK